MAADGHAVAVACRVLAVSESGFYAQHHRASSARAIRHAALTELIGRIHLDSRGTYGARRVHAELTLGHGLSVGRCAVELLMRRVGSLEHPDVRAPGGSPTWPRPPTWSNGASGATSPTGSHVTDITEHPTREGKLYCAAVLDAWSRRLVGWSIDSVATAALVTNAPREGHRGTPARRDGDPLRSGHRSSRPGRSRVERSTRGSCPRWVRSGVASITR
jgi:putative transposase